MIALELPEGLLLYVDSILIGLGLALGLLWTAWLADEASGLLDAGLACAAGALVGGRIAYASQNAAHFLEHPLQALQVFQGGLAWEGAWLGAVLAAWVFAALTHTSLARLADRLLPLAAMLAASAWLGSWLVGRAYGPPLAAPWGFPAPDAWGEITLRLPVQGIGALLTLGGFAWLNSLPRIYRQPGLAASLFWTGLALELVVLSSLIVDPISTWFSLRLDTWAALFYLAAGVVLLAYNLHRRRYTPAPTPESIGTRPHP